MEDSKEQGDFSSEEQGRTGSTALGKQAPNRCDEYIFSDLLTGKAHRQRRQRQTELAFRPALEDSGEMAYNCFHSWVRIISCRCIIQRTGIHSANCLFYQLINKPKKKKCTEGCTNCFRGQSTPVLT